MMAEDSSVNLLSSGAATTSRGGLSPQCLLLNHTQALEYLANDKDTIQISQIQSCYADNAYRPKLCSLELGDNDNFVTALDMHIRSSFFGFATSNGKLSIGGAFCKNDCLTPTLSTKVVWEGQNEAILQLKHHPIDQGIVAVQFETTEQEGKFYEPIKVLDLVQDGAPLLQINSPEIVYDFAWNFDSRSVLTVASEKCIRIVDLRSPKSYMAQFIPRIPYKIAYSHWRTSTLCCFTGKNLDFYDIRLLGTPLTSVAIDIANPFDILSLKWHRYQPEQIFVETSQQFYRVTLKNPIQLTGYMKTPLEIAKPQECASFLDLYHRRFSGSILEGCGENFFNESNELTVLDYEQHLCLSSEKNSVISMPYIWTEPFEIGRKENMCGIEISHLNQDEFHFENADFQGKSTDSNENFRIERLRGIFDAATEQRTVDVWEWRSKMREPIKGEIEQVSARDAEKESNLQRQLHQFVDYDFCDASEGSATLSLSEMSTLLLQDSRPCLEFSIPKLLHQLTVGGKEKKETKAITTIAEVTEDIGEEATEEERLEERKRKLEQELARATPGARTQLARQFKMLTESSAKMKGPKVEQARERRILDSILRNFEEAERLEKQDSEKSPLPLTASFSSNDHLFLCLDFAFDTDAIVAYSSSFDHSTSRLSLVWDTALQEGDSAQTSDAVLGRHIADIRMHETLKSSSKRMLYLMHQRIKDGWWTPKENTPINHRAHCATLIADSGLSALWKTWLKNVASMQYTTTLDYQGFEPPNVQGKRKRREMRREAKRAREANWQKYGKGFDIDGQMLRSDPMEREEYYSICEELTKPDESARNPQVIVTQPSRIREKKRVRMSTDSVEKEERDRDKENVQNQEQQRERGRPLTERPKYSRQRSFSEDSVSTAATMHDTHAQANGDKKKVRLKTRRQRSPRTPPAGSAPSTVLPATTTTAVAAHGLSLPWNRAYLEEKTLEDGQGRPEKSSSNKLMRSAVMEEDERGARSYMSDEDEAASDASLDTVRSLQENSEDSDLEKIISTNMCPIVDENLRMAASDIDVSVQSISQSFSSVLSISNAYTRQFCDLLQGDKRTIRQRMQERRNDILDQDRKQMSKPNGKKEKWIEHTKAKQTEIQEARNGPNGWIEDATSSEFDESPSDEEFTEIHGSGVRGDYEYYYHTPNPKRFREKRWAKIKEIIGEKRKEVRKTAGRENEEAEMQAVQRMNEVLTQQRVETLQIARNPDDVKRLFLAWIRKVSQIKQPQLSIETIFLSPTEFDIIERPSAWRDSSPLDEAIRKIGSSTALTTEQKLRALRSLRLGRRIPSYPHVIEQKNRSCILDAMWDCIFAAISGNDNLRKTPFDWPVALSASPSSAQHLSPQDPDKTNIMQKSPSDGVEIAASREKQGTKALVTASSLQRITSSKAENKTTKGVEIANDVLAADSPPNFLHLFETRRPSEDSMAQPKPSTSRRDSSDAMDNDRPVEEVPDRTSTANFADSSLKASPDLSIDFLSRKSTRAEAIAALEALPKDDQQKVMRMLSRLDQFEDEEGGKSIPRRNVEEVMVQEITARDIYAYSNYINGPVDDAEEPRETMTESEHEIIPEPIVQEPEPEPVIVEKRRRVHFDNKETDIMEYFASFHVDEDGGRLNFPFTEKQQQRVRGLLRRERENRPEEPRYVELNEDMINVKGLPGILHLCELIQKDAKKGWDRKFAYEDHCELFEHSKIFVSSHRNLILMSLGLPPLFLEFAPTVEETSSDGSDFEDERLIPFESSGSSTSSSTEEDYDDEAEKMLDELEQMRKSILMEAGICDPLPLDTKLDAKPSASILREPLTILDFQQNNKRIRTFTQKQLLRRKSKLLLHKEAYKKRNVNRKELNMEYCNSWLEQNRLLAEGKNLPDYISSLSHVQKATDLCVREPQIRLNKYRIASKCCRDLKQLARAAFQATCYLDAPNIYLIQKRISKVVNSKESKDIDNVGVFRSVNDIIERILMSDYAILKKESNELVNELDELRKISISSSLNCLSALCSLLRACLLCLSLNSPLEDIFKDSLSHLDPFDLVVFSTMFLPADELYGNIYRCCNMVEGLDRLVFVGLGYHESCLRVLANWSRFSSDFMLISQLLYIGRCQESDTTTLQTIKQLEEEVQKVQQINGDWKNEDNNSETREILQRFLRTYFSEIASIVDCEENNRIPTLTDKFNTNFTEEGDRMTDQQVSLQLRTDVQHLIRLLTAMLHGPRIQSLFKEFNEPKRDKDIPQMIEISCNFCFQMFSQQGGKKAKTDRRVGGASKREIDGDGEGEEMGESSSDAVQIGIPATTARKDKRHKRQSDESGTDGAEVVEEEANSGQAADFSTKTSTRRRHMKGCPNCGQPLPRCFTCLRRFGYPLKGTHERCPNFTICTLCNHGGHLDHVQDWFSRESCCAVAGCSCQCMQAVRRDIVPVVSRAADYRKDQLNPSIIQ